MTLLEEAKRYHELLIAHRRYIHAHAEVHLDLPLTSGYVEEQLRAMGYEPKRLGSSGLVVTAGGKLPGKVMLLRADMDALPIEEESGEPFASATGCMHACGHDLHTAMLLGAARLLKDHEDEIHGTVKLMFQPAEETLAGAKMMIDAGVLDAPRVDAAMMMHVTGSIPLPTGTVVIPDPHNGAAAADWFRITVQGKGGHGAMPNLSIDPLTALSFMHSALQTILAREIAPADVAVLTVGQMHGGNTSNVIPDTAMMSGTIRTRSNEVRDFVKQRLVEVAEGIAAVFRSTATVEFERGCPCFETDEELVKRLGGYARELLGERGVWDSAGVKSKIVSMASEDFSWISLEVPAACFYIATGSPAEGYAHPVHHPQVRFSEDVLPIGAAWYAYAALAWLREEAQTK